MSTEELIELVDQEENNLRSILRGQSATLDAIRKELHVHTEFNADMRADANTDRIARVKDALVPFGIDTSTWTG